jgi:hypothetical protein
LVPAFILALEEHAASGTATWIWISRNQFAWVVHASEAITTAATTTRQGALKDYEFVHSRSNCLSRSHVLGQRRVPTGLVLFPVVIAMLAPLRFALEENGVVKKEYMDILDTE